jgi:hypothetical protein
LFETELLCGPENKAQAQVRELGDTLPQCLGNLRKTKNSQPQISTWIEIIKIRVEVIEMGDQKYKTKN